MTDEPDSFTPESITTTTIPQRGFLRLVLKFSIFLILVGFVLIVTIYWWFLTNEQPPDDFPVNQPISILSGTEVRSITKILQAENVVRSEALLYYVLVLFHDPSDIKASTYIFEEPLTAREVATRLTEGDFDTNLIRFTHFEGERATQLAENAARILPEFDATRFIAAAEPLEGRLYPDTYFVPASFTDEDLLNLMQETFIEKIRPLQQQIASSTLTLDEILVLASIIEREANTPESMSLVSSILQNRLEIGMALQADASIEYVLDKPLAELTPEDLEIDSPYNTYLYPGLPPTPIGNPGRDAIVAVLEPAESEYFYYITDDDGVFHYAETYNEHLRNIERYLR